MEKYIDKISYFLFELKRRSVFKGITMYAASAFIILQVVDIITPALSLPPWIVTLCIILLAIGFPVFAVLSWIFDLTAKGISKTEKLSPVEISSFSKKDEKINWVLIILLSLLIVVTITFFSISRPNYAGFKNQDWVLLCDIENNTNDNLYDKSLLHALTITIDQSEYINVFPKQQISEVLARMGKENVTNIDLPLAMEIAQREGIKAVLALTVSEVESAHLLSIKIVVPMDGSIIWQHQVIVKNEKKILKELGKIANKTRKELGESLNEIHFQSVALPKATTTSLEALKCLVQGDVAWIHDNKFDEAEQFYLEAIRLDSSFALAHAELGSFYYWTNNRDKGEEHFNAALKFFDRLTKKEVLYLKARIERFRGKYDEAIVHYNVYLMDYPKSVAGWFGLGYCYMRINKFEEAINSFNKSLNIYQDDDAGTYINIASCYSLLHDYEKSIENYLKGFELNPNLITRNNLNNEFGFTYVKNEQYEKAKSVFKKMQDGNPEQKAGGLRSEALLFMYTGMYSNAIAKLNESNAIYKALGYNVSLVRNYLYQASVYKAMKLNDEFENLLSLTYEIIDNDSTGYEPWWLFLLGKLYVRNNNFELGELLLKEISNNIITGNKIDEAVYKILSGEINLMKGNLDESLELLESGLNLHSNTFLLESLANYYYQTDSVELAIKKYTEIIEESSALGWEAQEYWIQAHYNLGVLYEKIGRNSKAVESYKKLLDIWKDADSNIPLLKNCNRRMIELKNS